MFFFGGFESMFEIMFFLFGYVLERIATFRSSPVRSSQGHEKTCHAKLKGVDLFGQKAAGSS